MTQFSGRATSSLPELQTTKNFIKFVMFHELYEHYFIAKARLAFDDTFSTIATNRIHKMFSKMTCVVSICAIIVLEQSNRSSLLNRQGLALSFII